MESLGDLMATPPMYRDIGSSFLMQNMTIPMGGMGMAYGPINYGIKPMSRTLTHDKFESVQRQKEEQKRDVKKTVGILAGLAAGVLGLVLFRKKIPAVDKFLSKAVTGCKDFFKTKTPKLWDGIKGVLSKITSIFKKTPKALPPHVA